MQDAAHVRQLHELWTLVFGEDSSPPAIAGMAGDDSNPRGGERTWSELGFQQKHRPQADFRDTGEEFSCCPIAHLNIVQHASSISHAIHPPSDPTCPPLDIFCLVLTLLVLAGLLSLYLLRYYCNHHREIATSLIQAYHARDDHLGYPFAAAGINLTHMLAEVLLRKSDAKVGGGCEQGLS
eukprot:73261-Hanusia_phi.AAC.3